jgi:ABC-type Fe3+/spermidine/putrescine transport system ATPase subunit
VVMNAGHFEQVGTPQEVYGRPSSSFVARFLGLTNLLPAQIHGDAPQTAQTPLGLFHLPQTTSPGKYTLLIRPEIERENLGQRADGGAITGILTAVSFRGSDYHIDVAVRGDDGRSYPLDFILPTRHRGQLHLPAVGAEILLGLDASQLVLLN